MLAMLIMFVRPNHDMDLINRLYKYVYGDFNIMFR